MTLYATIFDEFNLPNATTWFYFSLLLAIALFFKFTRLLSVRNLDVLTLFLLVPGLLIVQDAHKGEGAASANDQPSPEEAPISAEQLDSSPALAKRTTSVASATQPARSRLLWFGYLWLFCGSVYFLVRCLLDLTLVRRPALTPNLNLAGLAWLGVALFVCLVAVSIRRPLGPPTPVGRQSAAVSETQRRAENIVKQELAPVAGLSSSRAAFWVESVSAMLCHLAIVLGLGIIGWRHFQDVHAGVAAATFYLLLPYTAYHVDQIHHVLPSALAIWALAAYRRPLLSGTLLGLAAGTGYFPIFLFPAWLSFYWKRGAGRFGAAFSFALGVCLCVIGMILWMDGDLAHSIQATLSQSEWQPWKLGQVTTEGFWTGAGWSAYRLPVFIAYLVFVAGTLFWPWPKNLAHLIALSGAIVISIQFWFADQGGVYVLWYLPFLLLLMFRPNLSDREAPPIPHESAGLERLRLRLVKWIARLLRLPEPAAHMQ